MSRPSLRRSGARGERLDFAGRNGSPGRPRAVPLNPEALADSSGPGSIAEGSLPMEGSRPQVARRLLPESRSEGASNDDQDASTRIYADRADDRGGDRRDPRQRGHLRLQAVPVPVQAHGGDDQPEGHRPARARLLRRQQRLLRPNHRGHAGRCAREEELGRRFQGSRSARSATSPRARSGTRTT